MWKRSIGFLIGLFYAATYGFWTMLITGGGHGNFLWFWLFCNTYFLGLFFPIAGLLVADLNPKSARISLAILLSVHFLALSGNLIFGLGQMTDDIQRSWDRVTHTSIVIMTIVHVLPPILLVVILTMKQLAISRHQKYLK